PVTKVCWYDVLMWLNAKSEMEGYETCYSVSGAVYRTGNSDNVSCNWNAEGYRLPTEAEWEYACRAGSTGAFNSNAANPDSVAWYGGNSSANTHPAATKAANAWGLCDMHGNVWEWCWDWYGPLTGASVTDPTGPAEGSARIIRGGSWFNEATLCRSAFRYTNARPYDRFDNVGFRPVLGL
ncbi:MAG TPA: SUMF1/EgtB/PvdO family nonheme iron enzyme, partial [Opitutales bacterium]|nr:SUMF1/EgtB/PvdO family nonheme iron enzyme [Opitutales bacterium]